MAGDLISVDVYDPDRVFSPTQLIQHFFRRRPLYQKVRDRYRHRTGLDGYFLLMAHGTEGNVDNDWRYCDSERHSHPIQEWIDGHDGKRLVLLLYCCNPYDLSVTSQRSLVLHVRERFNAITVLYGPGIRTRLYVPEFGYCDSSSRTRRVLDTL